MACRKADGRRSDWFCADILVSRDVFGESIQHFFLNWSDFKNFKNRNTKAKTLFKEKQAASFL